MCKFRGNDEAKVLKTLRNQHIRIVRHIFTKANDIKDCAHIAIQQKKIF